MRYQCLATLVFCSISALAQAATTAGYDSFTITDAAAAAMDSPTYTACMKKSEGVTVYIRNCGGAEYTKLEKRHMVALKTTSARLSKASAQKLQQNEKLWQANGMKSCNKPSQMNAGGTLELLENDACAHAEMKRRIAWLEQYK